MATGANRAWLTTEEQVRKLGRVGNFAHGSYVSPCHDCGEQFMGDKLARQCLPCAVHSTQRPEKVEG